MPDFVPSVPKKSVPKTKKMFHGFAKFFKRLSANCDLAEHDYANADPAIIQVIMPDFVAFVAYKSVARFCEILQALAGKSHKRINSVVYQTRRRRRCRK
jgi:hypothetical protein